MKLNGLLTFVLMWDLAHSRGASRFMRPIIGGQDVSISQYKYVASLRRWGVHHCGSAILSDKWAVTAAHCFHGENPEDFTLRSGTQSRLSGGVYHDVETIIIHDSFNIQTLSHDIALVELVKPISFDKTTASISLPPPGFILRDGNLASVSGWGYTSENGPLSVNLKTVSVPVINWTTCMEMYRGYRNVTETMICAGYRIGAKDACGSDSGGPLVCAGVLVGVVSWGRGCARPDSPGVYSSILFFNHWIVNKTAL